MFQVLLRNPGVFFSRVPLPSDQKGAEGQRSTVSDNLFNFIFLFSVDKVRGWCRKVLSMHSVFFVWSEKRCMKDWVNFPSLW